MRSTSIEVGSAGIAGFAGALLGTARGTASTLDFQMLTGLPFLHVPWLLLVAMWVLAVASLVTVGQRLHAVRTSPDAMEPIASPVEPQGDAREEATET